MGHAIHFLERLQRLSMPQADFALALYRDSELVRHILGQLKLPEGAERVALAVENGPDTPYVIVARDGGFVTCLGKGMSVGEAVVVTRERLDRLCAERVEFRQALQRVRSNTGIARQLFVRMYRGGRGLSREDFHTLRHLYPLYSRKLFEITTELADWLQDFRDKYRPARYRRRNAAALESLKMYWESSWAMGHLVALLGTRLREFLTSVAVEAGTEAISGFTISWLTAYAGSTPVAVRGAWAASRAGHDVLPSYKEVFETSSDFPLLMDSLVVLTAIGLRHRKLRAEVRKTLSRRRNPIFAPDSPHREALRMQKLLPLYERVLDAEESDMLAFHRMIGGGMAVDGAASLPPDHPVRGLRIEDVPEYLAYIVPLLNDTNLFRDVQAQITLPALLPWVVSVDIEELYLPADVVTASAPFQADAVLAQLDDYADLTAQSVPWVREATPGRNEPCSCGSGKKYKRCCGAGAVAP
jgi:SEC-C motif